MNWLHRFLVPSEQNGYRPTSLESTALSIMAILIMLSFAIANVQSILLVSSDWFISSILPAALVDLTNVNREENELGDLNRNKILDEAAQLKAEDMAANEYFSHESPTGVTPWYWFKRVGYEYAYAGENLAVHFSDSEDVVDAWMNSPGHRANILGDKYQEIGIGTAKGTYKGTPTVYVVQLFGTPLDQTVTVPDMKDLAVVETPASRAPRVLAASDAATMHAELTTVTIEASTTPSEVDTALVASHEVSVLVPTTTTAVAQTEKVFGVMQEEGEGTATLYSDFATSVVPASTALMPQEAKQSHTESFFVRLLSSPRMFLALSYLLLTFIVATLLAFSVVIEWRRQHPVQVAYAVGLVALMFVALKLHVVVTGGLLIM